MPFANLTNFTTHAITALPIFSTHHFRGLCTIVTLVKSEELFGSAVQYRQYSTTISYLLIIVSSVKTSLMSFSASDTGKVDKLQYFLLAEKTVRASDWQ